MSRTPYVEFIARRDVPNPQHLRSSGRLFTFVNEKREVRQCWLYIAMDRTSLTSELFLAIDVEHPTQVGLTLHEFDLRDYEQFLTDEPFNAEFTERGMFLHVLRSLLACDSTEYPNDANKLFALYLSRRQIAERDAFAMKLRAQLGLPTGA